MRFRSLHLWVIAFLLLAPAAAHALPVGLLDKDRVGLSCFDKPNTIIALNCWLDKNPAVAAAMLYGDSSVFGDGPWPNWPTAAKLQMYLYFNQMVVWYKAGMPPQFPHPFPMPIPPGGPIQNPDPSNPNLLPMFWMTEAMGKRVYLSQVANNLAAELTGAFPWTITAYTPDELTLLLSMNESMFYEPNAASPGYFFQYDNPSPATPGYTVTFFKNKQLIGADAADTIGRLFTWERNLTHYFYENVDPTQDVSPFFWGPNTPPIPDGMIMHGTTYTGPGGPQFGHYTAGCSGTQDFMKSVLRAVNIPVQRHWVSCGHAAPIFPTADMALTHGDDPYNWLGAFTPFPGFSTPVASQYFVTINDLNQLFPTGQTDEECSRHVGIQVANLAIEFASDALMNFYCQDRVSGADHPSGQVYDFMKFYYPSVSTLEGMGLWTNLETKVNATNFCGS